MKDAEQTLLRVRQFSIGKITDAGIESDGEIALREILAQPQAEARLAVVLENGTPTGQLYALLGLRQVNRGEFAEAYPRFRNAKEIVETMEGCLVGRTQAGRIVRKIAQGEYDRAWRNGERRQSGARRASEANDGSRRE